VWDLETIRAINNEVGSDARMLGKEPLRLTSETELAAWPPFPIPHLGSACEDFDEEGERVDTLFVDSSGFGSDSEPALTMDQFKTRLQELLKEHGALDLAIEEQGQFQLYVAVWKVTNGS
jgi:hypothetical protein